MKITLAFDSFKGSLTSLQVADAFEEGFRSVICDCEVLKLPIADGGEGTAAALVSALGGTMVETIVNDPLAGDLCSISGSGRSPGEGNGNPLQYSCLENPMDREA